ncbi:MAG: DNA methyltransferase [Verrucomicrobiae bacterium]|nr:DNA methyltransferase [Verrucomicrobiae bacterium]
MIVEQPTLPAFSLPKQQAQAHSAPSRRLEKAEREDNKLKMSDRAAHQWYRFVLSFPPHLVRDYAEKFGLNGRHQVLDPFCGTGTTVVECKKLGIRAVGLESNPVACFASRTKVQWNIDPQKLLRHALTVADTANERLERDGYFEDDTQRLLERPVVKKAPLRTLPTEVTNLLLTNSISPLPLHKALVLLEALAEHHDDRFVNHERLGLATALVNGISNLHFGPEVGVGQAKRDAPVVSLWLDGVKAMAQDLEILPRGETPEAVIYQADAREGASMLPANSVDAVITSPPYPNEKDYTRTTRLESVLLGFIKSKEDLRDLKKNLVRSNTRGVYKSDADDSHVAGHQEIERIAAAIENRRIELNKDSGFERLYARVTKLYFGGMTRHLAELRRVLRPGAQLAYVVGDQASYLRVMIRTGQLLADIAESLGYEVVGLDLFRTRLATATREQLREEVVVLRWPGDKREKKGSK